MCQGLNILKETNVILPILVYQIKGTFEIDSNTRASWLMITGNLYTDNSIIAATILKLIIILMIPTAQFVPVCWVIGSCSKLSIVLPLLFIGSYEKSKLDYWPFYVEIWTLLELRFAWLS